MPEKEEEKIEQEDGIIEYPDGVEPDEPIEPMEGEEAGDKKEEKPEEKPEKKEESPRFKLDTPEEPETKEEGEAITEIVHNGQVYKFTKDKIVELAQKGFDYDFKVGPHGKIVQMIEADPEIASMVNNHWQKKISGEATEAPQFKVKGIDEYENETEWLEDNLREAINFGRSQVPQAAPQPARNTAVADALKMRDPEHFNTVLNKLPEYASQLSVSDYQKIDSDMGSLCKFYDFVKEQELSKRVTPPKPGFSVKSGGSSAPKSEPVVGAAWTLSKDSFQKQLDKIKGYN